MLHETWLRTILHPSQVLIPTCWTVGTWPAGYVGLIAMTLNCISKAHFVVYGILVYPCPCADKWIKAMKVDGRVWRQTTTLVMINKCCVNVKVYLKLSASASASNHIHLFHLPMKHIEYREELYTPQCLSSKHITINQPCWSNEILDAPNYIYHVV